MNKSFYFSYLSVFNFSSPDHMLVELLAAVREGSAARLQAVLTDTTSGTTEWDRRSRYGTALHVAAYFGQAHLVKLLLENGADINARNEEGDTPLHKAALTGRLPVVNLLLRHPEVDLTAENKEGQSCVAMAKNREVSVAIEQAQQTYIEETTRQLLDSARAGDWQRLQQLLNKTNTKLLNLNLRDRQTGNTLLHYAAKAGRKELVVSILQQGGDPNVKNAEKMTPAEVTRSDHIRLLLQSDKNRSDQMSAPDLVHTEGSLFRWVNYATGWRKRWFVIDHGMLFHYYSKDEVQDGPRGTVRLAGASILARKNDNRVFIVRGRNSVTYHLRAENEKERDRWINALMQAARADQVLQRKLSSDLLVTTKGEPQYEESFEVMLTNLRLQRQSLDKQLQRITDALSADERTSELGDNFGVAASSMLDTVSSVVKTAEERVQFWQKRCERTEVQQLALQDSLRLLAVERNELERTAGQMMRHQMANSPHETIDDSADDKFYDAADTDTLDEEPLPSPFTSPAAVAAKQIVRRTKLSAPMKDRSEVSLWTVIKEFVGKDLSKIAVPVYFNEPLSFLQKFSEDLEYHTLLDRAAKANTSIERMQWVAAFAVSPYSSTTRTAKPFNPILGETYEMLREDLGYKYFAEQVSHHPPISACHCEGNGYTYFAEAHIKNRFLGNVLEVYPSGSFHVILHATKEHFVWHRVKTVVHNLIIGSVWVDNYGEMAIKNVTTGETCVLDFKQRGWWGSNYAEVDGLVKDSRGVPRIRVHGHWNTQLESVLVDESGKHDPSTKPKLLWRRNVPLPESTKFYNFTQFSMELNELLVGMENIIAPTDSRLRPDQRAMENGDLDLAVKEKLRLEEKQRKAKKEREAAGHEWSPQWFRPAVDAETGESSWEYKGQYWEARQARDWSDAADIF